MANFHHTDRRRDAVPPDVGLIGRHVVHPIYDVLMDYYPGDEASGPLLGQINGLDLPAVNSPGTTVGPGGADARTYSTSGGSYFRNNPTGAERVVGSDATGYSWWTWLYVNSAGFTSGYRGILCQSNYASPPQNGFQLFCYYNSGSPYLHIDSGVGGGFSIAVNSTLFSLDAWHFVYGQCDVSASRAGIRLDGGSLTLGGVSGHTYVGPTAAGSQFLVGLNFAGLDGAMCGTGFAHEPLETKHVDWLYNSGVGPRTADEILAYKG